MTDKILVGYFPLTLKNALELFNKNLLSFWEGERYLRLLIKPAYKFILKYVSTFFNKTLIYHSYSCEIAYKRTGQIYEANIFYKNS